MHDQSNNVLIQDANIHLVEDAESELNDAENGVKLEQEMTKKGKDKGKEKAKKKKVIEFKWSKRPTPKQKKSFNLEAHITHPFPEQYTPFDVFSVATSKNVKMH